MAIKGSLKEASLPDVLQLLALGQKTGCLSIADRSNFGYIYFDRGRISYASIVNRPDRLGDILVKHEKITQDQLDAAIHRQAKERDKKLGEILVLQNVLTQQELERYMRMQIEESVYYLLDRKSTRLNSSHQIISYAVFCLKKKKYYNTYVFYEAFSHDRRTREAQTSN